MFYPLLAEAPRSRSLGGGGRGVSIYTIYIYTQIFKGYSGMFFNGQTLKTLNPKGLGLQGLAFPTIYKPLPFRV